MMLGYQFVRSLYDLQFPMVGAVSATDARAQCDGQPGPCATVILFTLNLVQYETYCPPNFLQFSPDEQAVVRWTEPVLRTREGVEQRMIGNHLPGARLQLGTTWVEYSLPAHPSQSATTHIACSFTVSLS